jgi:hypothetical protein
VLHHPESRHCREHLAQLTEGLAVGLEQGIEEGAPAAVGQRLEDGLVRRLVVARAVDGASIGYRLVTYQPLLLIIPDRIGRD